MRFEYWNTADGTWAWQLKTMLGETLARGERCGTREECLAAIRAVKLAASAPSIALGAAPAGASPDDGLVRLRADRT